MIPYQTTSCCFILSLAEAANILLAVRQHKVDHSQPCFPSQTDAVEPLPTTRTPPPELALCFQPPVKTHALSETLHVWSLSEEPPLGRVRVMLSFSNVIDVVPEWNSDLWVRTLETLNKLNKVRIHFMFVHLTLDMQPPARWS